MTLAPKIEGTVTIRSAAPEFVQAFRRRVEAGTLLGPPHPRSNYAIADAGPDHLRVLAADWWTAINVGLNDVDLRLAKPGGVDYLVRYWRWAGYAFALSGTLGIIGLVLLLAFDARGYIERHPSSMLPGLTVDHHVRIAWAMVVFWGFVWPWLLIALHKRPLRRLVSRLISDVDAGAGRG